MKKEVYTISQLLLFKRLWLESNKRSFISGLHLRDYMNNQMCLDIFAHVLPKSENKYPYFKLYAKNIVLLTPEEHDLWDKGTKEAREKYDKKLQEITNGKGRADWGKLEKLAEELKGEYKKLFPSNIGMIIGFKYSPEDVYSKIEVLNEKFFKNLRAT